MSAFPELERVDVPRHTTWGGPLLPHPIRGGVDYYKRASTVASSIASRRSIEEWQMRVVAKGIASRQDLRALAMSMDIDTDRDDFNELCQRALDAGGGNVRSNIGTANHSFTSQLEWMSTYAPDQLDDWLHTSVPVEAIPDLMAYQSAMTQAGLQVPVKYIERTTLNTEIMAAGTFDFPVWRPGWVKPRVGDKKTGKRYYDKKTGKEVFYGVDEWCIQLAIYAHGEVLCPAKWDHGPMRITDRAQYEPMLGFDQEVGVIVSLPQGSGECTIYEVDLEAGWYAAKLARDVMDWRKRKNLHRVLQDTVVATTTVRAETLGPDPFAIAAPLVIQDRERITIDQPGSEVHTRVITTANVVDVSLDNAPNVFGYGLEVISAEVVTETPAAKPARKRASRKAALKAPAPDPIESPSAAQAAEMAMAKIGVRIADSLLDAADHLSDAELDGVIDSGALPSVLAQAAHPDGIAGLARDARMQTLRKQVAAAASKTDLGVLWERNQDVWTEELTDIGAVRLATLEMSGAEL